MNLQPVDIAIPGDFKYVNDGVSHEHVKHLRETGFANDDLARSMEQNVTTDWGLFPLGYRLYPEHRGGHAVGVHCWVYPENNPTFSEDQTRETYTGIYLAIFQEPSPSGIMEDCRVLFPDTRREGRMTIVVNELISHGYDWTNTVTGETVDRLERNMMHVPGVAVWTASYRTDAEFLEALRQAHALMSDKAHLQALAALTPPSIPII